MDDNEAVNGRKNYSSLEIEEDHGEGIVAGLSRARLRAHVRGSDPAFVDVGNSSVQGFRELLRSKTAYVLRNCLVLGALGWLVVLYIASMDQEVESLTSEDSRGVHQSSFGGEKNTGTLTGAKAHGEHEEHEIHDISWPLDNSGQPVQSISQVNILNHNGHYWHDPHNSPFASALYARDSNLLDKEQNKFLARQNASKIKYGSWNFTDQYHDGHGARPKFDFEDYRDHDARFSDFVGDFWQTDRNYTEHLVDEARKLIYRMREAIFEEYGHGSLNNDGTQMINANLTERAELFKVITENFSVNSNGEAVDPKTKEKLTGIAYVSAPAMEALSRKLLHALLTSGHMFVVQVGDAAAAGHGNNFFQSSVMQFHYIMEPVLDFLGIRLISRNMAMRDSPILLSALAGGDLYGEADILWHVPSDSDSDGEKALLYRQMILSGERIPIILGKPAFLEEHIWWGNLQPGDEICQDSQLEVCDMDAFNSVCWEDRKNLSPPTKQDKEVKRESYPSYRRHQLESRKLAMLMLDALSDALDMWLKGIDKGGFPLAEIYWHVGPRNDKVREAIRTSANDDEITDCEKMMGEELKMVCRVEMHGRSEYLPRIRQEATSIRSLLPEDSAAIANSYNDGFYNGIDVLPWAWKIPEDQVDVHSVAILTSVPPPTDGDSNKPDEDYLQDLEDEEEEDATRQGADHEEPHDLNPIDGGGRRYRGLVDDDANPGKGWYLTNPVAGFCDGSAQSECGRSRESTCLLAGHNDYHGGILGDALSGWLVLEIEGLTEGIILLRFGAADQMNPATDGWLTVNNEDGQHEKRFQLPDDFEFQYAVDEEVVTLSKEEFLGKGMTLREGVSVFPIMVDPTLQDRIVDDDGETFRVAIRTKSNAEPRKALIMITHVYYA